MTASHPSPAASDSAPRLLLWDIDGTLITTGAAGQRALALATAERFGGDGDLGEIEVAGRTDVGITHQILRKFGVPVNPETVGEFLERYLELLAEELPRSQGRVLPGVPELLELAAASPHTTLGLLTGNLERGAKLKLEHYGLWQYFRFGAFADDHHDRNELGAFAVQRALAATGQRFLGAQTDVIGDTGHDVACGKIFGARTVAVATGGWTRAQLEETKPDFLFDDFGDAAGVARTLGW